MYYYSVVGAIDNAARREYNTSRVERNHSVVLEVHQVECAYIRKQVG